MTVFLISTAVEQFGFFWELTLVNFQRINCQLLGVSVDRRKQDVILKFMLSNRQIVYCNSFDVLYISKGRQF